WLKVPVPLIVPVPPLAVTVITALPPLHRIGVVSDEPTVIALGCVIFPVVVAVQLLATVTVQDYLPISWLKVPVPLIVPVPPLAVTVITALPPWHKIGVVSDEPTVIALGSVIVPVVVAVQLLASVTVYE